MSVVLVINSGSSSFKYQLIDVESQEALASGLVERIGEPLGKAKHDVGDVASTIELPIPGIVLDNSALYIFLGWFLLAVGSVLPPRNAGASRPNGPEPSSR